MSNYTREDVERARDLVDHPLYANQVEMHPLLQQDDLYSFLRENDVYTVAYSPLAQGEVFEVPELVDIADAHNTTAAAVSLAWLLSRDGVAAIPRSSSEEHIRANLEAHEVELTEAEIDRIDSIDRSLRCEDPGWIEW